MIKTRNNDFLPQGLEFFVQSIYFERQYPTGKDRILSKLIGGSWFHSQCVLDTQKVQHEEPVFNK